MIPISQEMLTKMVPQMQGQTASDPDNLLAEQSFSDFMAAAGAGDEARLDDLKSELPEEMQAWLDHLTEQGMPLPEMANLLRGVGNLSPDALAELRAGLADPANWPGVQDVRAAGLTSLQSASPAALPEGGLVQGGGGAPANPTVASSSPAPDAQPLDLMMQQLQWRQPQTEAPLLPDGAELSLTEALPEDVLARLAGGRSAPGAAGAGGANIGLTPAGVAAPGLLPGLEPGMSDAEGGLGEGFNRLLQGTGTLNPGNGALGGGDFAATLMEASDGADPLNLLQGLRATAGTAATPAASTAPPVPMAPLRLTGDNVAGGLAERMVWLVNQDQQVAEIKVTPANLGPLEIRLTLQQDQASVAFSSPHAAVRDTLEAAMPRLRELLNQQDIQLVQAEVGGQSQQGRSAQTADGSSGGQSGSGEGGDAHNGDGRAPDGHPGAEGDAPRSLLSGLGGLDTYA